MKARIATALALVTLLPSTAQAMVPSDHDGVAGSTPVLKRLPQARGGSCVTKPTRHAAGVSVLSDSVPYRVSTAAIRRNR